MTGFKEIQMRIRDTKRCSPGGFALWAVSIFILFLIVHLLGFREYASILSGTLPKGPFGQFLNGFFAVLYLLLYLGAMVLSPILAIAAVVFRGLEKMTATRRTVWRHPRL